MTGARSIRGSLGAYFKASVAAVLLLGLVLWLGPEGGEPLGGRVSLAPYGPWTGATFDDGTSVRELAAPGTLMLPPGTYRVVLFGAGDRTAVRELVVAAADDVEL